MAINLIHVLGAVRTALGGPFKDERDAGLAAVDVIFGDDRDYDTLEIEDTVARTRKVVAIRQTPIRVVQTTTGDWVHVRGALFSTQQAAETAATVRSRPKLKGSP